MSSLEVIFRKLNVTLPCDVQIKMIWWVNALVNDSSKLFESYWDDLFHQRNAGVIFIFFNAVGNVIDDIICVEQEH